MSALLTVGVVGYISLSYMNYYIPSLIRADKINLDKFKKEPYGRNELVGELETPFYVIVEASIFVIYPFLIFWALAVIVCSDPGHITPNLMGKYL